MFIFKRVEAQNFLSFDKLDLELDGKGLTLVNGRNLTNDSFDGNASGKTSIFNAIIWGLFGKTPNMLAADDVVNNRAGKNTFVKLYLENNGDTYVIERYRKHSKFKNTVKFFRGESDLTDKSTKDTDKRIVELFGIDYVTFTNTVFFGQGNIVSFASATDKERKEILEQVTGIEVYRKAQDVAKEKVKESNLQKATVEVAIKALQSDLQRLDEVETAQVNAYSYTHQMLLTAHKELENLNDQQIPDKQHLQEQLNSLAEPDASVLNETPEGATKLLEEIDSGEQSYNRLKEWLDAAQVRKMSSLIEAKNLKETYASLDTSDKCPTCGAPIDNNHIIQERQRLTEAIEPLDLEVSTIEEQQKQVQEVANDYQAAITSSRKAYADVVEAHRRGYYESLEVYRSNRSELERQVQQITFAEQQRETAKKSIEGRIAELSSVPVPVRDEAKRAQIDKEIAQNEEQLKLITLATTKYEDAVEMFSNKGIRSVVLDLVTPFLNERANHYSNILTGGEIEILFSTQKENKDGSLADKFEVEIKNLHGGSDYRANSGGEKKRIDLAISFALQDLLLSKSDMQTNIALYDECFEALDMIGCENVIEVLREKQSQIGTIFVITHNEALKNLFDKVLTVEKKDGVSKIMEEGN